MACILAVKLRSSKQAWIVFLDPFLDFLMWKANMHSDQAFSQSILKYDIYDSNRMIKLEIMCSIFSQFSLKVRIPCTLNANRECGSTSHIFSSLIM